MFKKIRQHKIYQDAWLTFFQDEIQFPDGSLGTYAWAQRKSGVGVVVVTSDKKILLQKEYRYIIGEYSWEIQGGGVDEHESLADAALRELREETGIEAPLIEKIGVFYPLNSFNTEQVTLFLARTDVRANPVHAQTEVSEGISEYKYVAFDEALSMIDAGEIIDALTANAIQMVVRRLSSV